MKTPKALDKLNALDKLSLLDGVNLALTHRAIRRRLDASPERFEEERAVFQELETALGNYVAAHEAVSALARDLLEAVNTADYVAESPYGTVNNALVEELRRK